MPFAQDTQSQIRSAPEPGLEFRHVATADEGGVSITRRIVFRPVRAGGFGAGHKDQTKCIFARVARARSYKGEMRAART